MARLRQILAMALALAALPAFAAAGELPAPASAGDAAEYAPGELLVRFEHGGERLIELPAGVGVEDAASALAANDRVAYATPNYIARAAAPSLIPNDPGSAGIPGGWQQLQWGFLPCGSGCETGGVKPEPLPYEARGGIDAPAAWETVRVRGRAGAAGVRIAVLDTGVAFRRLKPRFSKSPDFARRQFLDGYDFVDYDRHPLDEEGHGTHIAGTIGEQTNNGRGLTGLAYGAKLIPVRVLDSLGEGRARDIARGIRYALKHGARIINLSFEFGPVVQSCKDIRGVCAAIRAANRKQAIVLSAAGNGSGGAVAFPGRAPGVVAIGAATEGACLANYSNRGLGLDLIAPGGSGEGGTACATPDRPIFQVTLDGPGLHSFGIPPGYMGTSMATAHASGVAALVLASGVLGPRPASPRLECQLEATARKESLGEPYDPALFGAGLLDAARAVTSAAC